MKLKELNKEDEKEETLKEVDERNKYYASLLDFYSAHKQKVHIELINERFYNGAIMEILDDKLMLDEVNLGAMPIFFSQIKVLEAFKEKEK